MRNGRVLVRGAIKISATVRHFEGALVHVYLEESTRQDIAASMVAETQIENVKHQSSEGCTAITVIPFELEIADEIKLGKTYSLQVWVDVIPDGNRRAAEDLYSDHAYEVSTGRDNHFVEITIDG